MIRLTVACPHCGSRVEVTVADSSTPASCTFCGGKMAVPSDHTAGAAAGEAAVPPAPSVMAGPPTPPPPPGLPQPVVTPADSPPPAAVNAPLAREFHTVVIPTEDGGQVTLRDEAKVVKLGHRVRVVRMLDRDERAHRRRRKNFVTWCLCGAVLTVIAWILLRLT